MTNREAIRFPSSFFWINNEGLFEQIHFVDAIQLVKSMEHTLLTYEYFVCIVVVAHTVDKIDNMGC